MATVRLNGAAIRDWPSFHAESRAAFDFPDYYGDNMDAWIDCLSYLRDDDGMCKFRLGADEVLTIEVDGSALLRQHAPAILDEVEACVDELNDRYADYGEPPALKLVLR